MKETKPLSKYVFHSLVSNLNRKGLTMRGYRGFRSVVCLSYDVDQLIGYNYLEEIAERLSRSRLKATFHILTNWEYKIEWNKIRQIMEAGFEIGLHGGRHDIALGYRNKHDIRLEIHRAVSVIPFRIDGYRAPSLCMTPRLMEVIAEMGFKYDSSLPMSNMYYKDTETCFPYPFFPRNLWEFPVAIQDSTLFLDLKLSEDDALNKMIAIIEDISELGGVCIINLHPYIMIKKKLFQSLLIKYLSNQHEILICTHKELYEYIREVTSFLSV